MGRIRPSIVQNVRLVGGCPPLQAPGGPASSLSRSGGAPPLKAVMVRHAGGGPIAKHGATGPTPARRQGPAGFYLTDLNPAHQALGANAKAGSQPSLCGDWSLGIGTYGSELALLGVAAAGVRNPQGTLRRLPLGRCVRRPGQKAAGKRNSEKGAVRPATTATARLVPRGLGQSEGRNLKVWLFSTSPSPAPEVLIETA
jgi:hypothetical protein